MAKLKIQYVGPIREGFQENGGFLDVNGVTVFIGSQGSGKSTFAKIYSTLSWIEKALVRGDFNEAFLRRYNRFKKHISYQNIDDYISEKSVIHYVGKAYELEFSNNELKTVNRFNVENFEFPKIMYVPAERNFISSIDRPDLVKRLPLPLYTFLDEYEDAKQKLSSEVELPFGDLKFEYKKNGKKSLLVGEEYSVDLLQASSGFQSFIPLFLVTRNISNELNSGEQLSRKSINNEEENKIRKEIDRLFGNVNISEDVRRVLLEKLSARFRPSCFINIVEEPEQNLYPESQKYVLYDLLYHRNIRPQNKLLITSHSPFILNYLALSIKAALVKECIGVDGSAELLSKLNDIVPSGSEIDSREVDIYEIHKNGNIVRLPKYRGIPSDSNFLNKNLEETNVLYDALMDIEQELQ